MSRFRFNRLIKKYSYGTVSNIADTTGHYDQDQGGKWIPGETIETVIDPAAIVPPSRDDLSNDEGGMYNRDSRKLYCYVKMPKGSKIKHVHSKGSVREYKIMGSADYGDFDKEGDGLFIYLLHRQGGDED